MADNRNTKREFSSSTLKIPRNENTKIYLIPKEKLACVNKKLEIKDVGEVNFKGIGEAEERKHFLYKVNKEKLKEIISNCEKGGKIDIFRLNEDGITYEPISSMERNNVVKVSKQKSSNNRSNNRGNNNRGNNTKKKFNYNRNTSPSKKAANQKIRDARKKARNEPIDDPFNGPGLFNNNNRNNISKRPDIPKPPPMPCNMGLDLNEEFCDELEHCEYDTVNKKCLSKGSKPQIPIPPPRPCNMGMDEDESACNALDYCEYDSDGKKCKKKSNVPQPPDAPPIPCFLGMDDNEEACNKLDYCEYDSSAKKCKNKSDVPPPPKAPPIPCFLGMDDNEDACNKLDYCEYDSTAKKCKDKSGVPVAPPLPCFMGMDDNEDMCNKVPHCEYDSSEKKCKTKKSLQKVNSKSSRKAPGSNNAHSRAMNLIKSKGQTGLRHVNKPSKKAPGSNNAHSRAMNLIKSRGKSGLKHVSEKAKKSSGSTDAGISSLFETEDAEPVLILSSTEKPDKDTLLVERIIENKELVKEFKDLSDEDIKEKVDNYIKDTSWQTSVYAPFNLGKRSKDPSQCEDDDDKEAGLYLIPDDKLNIVSICYNADDDDWS